MVTESHRKLIENFYKLKAENKRLREANQWQPIETAPKDETIWCYFPEQPVKYETARYFKERDGSEFTNVQPWGRDGSWACSRPTHWMPLPEPPKENGND